MKKLQLHWQIFIALILAVFYGLFLTDYVGYVAWMGDVFLRALRMVIVPLILSSIVSGVANIGGADNLGRLGLKTMAYYLSTSTFAIITGLMLVNLIQPGVGTDLGAAKVVEGLGEAQESFGDTLINMIPTNIFTAFSEGNILSIIFFAILFGFFITKTPDKYKTYLTDGFNSLFKVMMKITMFIIKFTPLGILGIVARQVAETEDLVNTAERLGLYSLTVIGALGFHALFTLPVMLKFIGKINPLKHFKAVTVPLLTAFSTSSSSATLPLTMEAVENKAGVSNRITSFTLPLGATVNMDGTALYECVAVMFIAQAYGAEMTFVQQILIVITALLASIGAAGIPMAGIVMMSVILSAVNLPLEGIGLILAIDRPLDMCRTMINNWSDSCGATIIAKSEGEKLKV